MVSQALDKNMLEILNIKLYVSFLSFTGLLVNGKL